MSAHAGRRVVITGAGAGIGRAIALAYVDEGARVHVCDRDADAARRPVVGEATSRAGGGVSAEGTWNGCSPALGRLGASCLVNNRGRPAPPGRRNARFDGWRRTMAATSTACFSAPRAAVPALARAGRGSIVNLSSTAGLHGYPLRSPYAAAKWGVIGFTRTLAMELGPAGIRVNAICPGSVRGDRIDRVIAAQAATRGVSEEAVRQNWLRQISLRRFVDAEDVAARGLPHVDAGCEDIRAGASLDGHTEGLVRATRAATQRRITEKRRHRAAWFTKLGSAVDVLEWVSGRQPVRPGEVRVPVRASGINRST